MKTMKTENIIGIGLNHHELSKVCRGEPLMVEVDGKRVVICYGSEVELEKEFSFFEKSIEK